MKYRRTRNPKDMQDDNGNKDQNGTSNSSAMISGMKRVYPKHGKCILNCMKLAANN